MMNLVRIVEIANVALVGEIRSESNNSSFTVNNSLNMNISVLHDVTSRSVTERHKHLDGTVICNMVE
jgi:hypothetical protein